MGKKAKVSAPVQAPVAGAAGATAQAATVLHMQVKAGVSYRGARAAWYAAALAHNGMPVAAYLLACKQQPPSLPKSGVAEPPQGWLAYFVRQGVVTLTPA